MRDLEVSIVGDLRDINPEDGNVDVEVVLRDSRRFGATFFTRRNLKTIMSNYSRTGECASGLYFWCADMIVVETLSMEVIHKTVESLLDSGELEMAFGELHEIEK